jgi:hydrogenase assembly chaperone HypC/HupF
MCIAFPGRVLSVDEAGAVVELRGTRRRASTLLIPDVVIGELVAVAAGTIVERLDSEAFAELEALLHPAVVAGTKGDPDVRTH